MLQDFVFDQVVGALIVEVILRICLVDFLFAKSCV